MQRHIFLGATGALLIAIAAGRAVARDDGQLWTSANANVKLNDKWRLSQELTARFSDNRKGLYEIESVTMLGYRVGKSVTLAGGYVYNPLYSNGEFSGREHRAREQITFDNLAQFGRGKLSARLRLEERWRQNADGMALRVRPYVKYSIPLKKGGKTSLNLSNETFVNLKNTSFQKTDGVDRMRNLIAISTPLSRTLGIEGGYLNQYGFVRDGDDTVDHVATISMSLNL